MQDHFARVRETMKGMHISSHNKVIGCTLACTWQPMMAGWGNQSLFVQESMEARKCMHVPCGWREQKYRPGGADMGRAHEQPPSLPPSFRYDCQTRVRGAPAPASPPAAYTSKPFGGVQSCSPAGAAASSLISACWQKGHSVWIARRRLPVAMDESWLQSLEPCEVS